MFRRRKVSGVIWAGPIFHIGGYGNVSRNFLKGFKQIGFPIKVVDIGPDDSEWLDSQTVKDLKGMAETDVGPYPVAVVHTAPDAYPHVQLGNTVKRIGYTIFETDRIPVQWVPICNQTDEIWIPSHFNFSTFANSGVYEERLRIFPYGVDTEFFKPINEKVSIKDKKSFCFLYVSLFDYRKGFDLLLEAYLKEFNASDDVSLIIKTSFDPGSEVEPDSDPAMYIESQIYELIADKINLQEKHLPHFKIMTDRLDQRQLRALYNTCDLYISTDRANGWGMPCMEAMAMGKPAATINWSGSTEFMNEKNSLLINPSGRLVPVDERLAKTRSIYEGHQWAEVRVEEVRRVMRYAYENSELLPMIGRKAMKDIRANYTLAKTAGSIRKHLRSLKVPKKLPSAEH